MKVLVLGTNGQVGSELMRAAWPAGTALAGFDHPDFDMTRPESLAHLLGRIGPAAVINATAYTAVDKAEQEPALAFAVNRDGPGALARLCAERAIPLLHISTDYVFDGSKDGAYREDDPIRPLGVYGASKAAGEQAVRELAPRHLILRTAWVYCAHGANFVKTMLRLGAERDEVRVVADQHGNPTAAADLAAALAALAIRAGRADAPFGTYHFAGRGDTTWHGLAEAVFRHQQRATGRRPRLVAIATADYPTPARRPANSRLDCRLIEERCGLTAPAWPDSLARVLAELLPVG